MSRAIDEKVVELKFDNKQFESGVKESLSTLDKLKQAVDKNISSKSFDEVTKAANSMDLSGIAKSVDFLADRFSAFGIIGMTVIQNITNALLGGLSNAIKTTTDTIISGGIKRAMNIENAHFQLQGLMDDENEVQAVMAAAMESVDGTAYAYDEAAKAASMFAATGLRTGGDLENSLKAVAGVAATTNSEYSGIADVFTKVAGQGRVMGDDLNRLAVRGLNAASELTKFMNKVNKDGGEASEEVQQYVKELTDGIDITEAELREMVRKGKISFDLFSEAMAITFGEHAKDANQTFTGSMANIRAALARTGAMFVSPLVTQNGEFVQFFNAIRVKVNEFNKALGVTNGIAEQFTTFVKGIVTQLTDFVKGIKVAHTYVERFADGTEKVYQSSHIMIEKIGEDGYRAIVDDFYTPFGAVNDIVQSLVNIFKGIVSVITPVGKAFTNVFSMDPTNIYKAIEGFRKLTEEMTLSQRHSEQLETLFTGIFSVIKSIVSIIGKFISALKDTEAPTVSLSDGIFDLFEGIGNVLIAFADFIDQSPTIQKAIELVANGVSFFVGLISEAISAIGNFFTTSSYESVLTVAGNIFEGLKTVFSGLYDLLLAVVGLFGELFSSITGAELPVGSFATNLSEGFKNLCEKVGETISNLTDFIKQSETVKKAIEVISGAANTAIETFSNGFGSIAELIKSFNITNFLEKVSNAIDDLKTSIFNALPDWVQEYLSKLKETFSKVVEDVKNFDLESLKKDFAEFGNVFKDFNDAVLRLEDIKQGIVEFFDFSEEESGINRIIEAGNKLVSWLKTKFGPQIEEMNVPGIVASGSFLWVLFQMGNVLKSLADFMRSGGKIVAEVPEVLKSLKKALDSYTSSNNANSFKEIAKSIMMVSASLLVLSLIKPERLWPAIAAIGVIGAALTALTLAMAAKKKLDQEAPVTSIFGVLNTLAKGINESLENLTKPNTVDSWSNAVLKIVVAVGLVIGEIASVIYLINKYSMSEFQRAAGIVGIIAGILIAMAVTLTLMGEQLKNGMKEFKNLSIGIAAMSTAILLSVLAIKEVIGIELPSDYALKIGIITGLFGIMKLLIDAFRKANKTSNDGLSMGLAIVSMAVLIKASIWAIKEIMDIEIPKDYTKRLLLIGAMFAGVGVLVLAVAGANWLSHGNNSMNSFSTFLGIAALIAASIYALKEIMKMEFTDDWKRRFELLAEILLVVASVTAIVELFARGGKGVEAFGTFLGMSLLLGSILVALKVMEQYDFASLKRNTILLSGILLALALTLSGAGTISGAGAGLAVLSMSLLVVSIVTSLMILSMMNDDSLRKGALALSVVLLTLAVTFAGVGQITNGDSWKPVLAMVPVIASIVAGLVVLSTVSWQGLLAGAIALDSVLMTLAFTFSKFGEGGDADGKQLIQNAVVFLELVAVIAEIGTVLYVLSGQPWANMLASGAAVSAVLLAYAKAFQMISGVEIDTEDVQKYLLGCVSIIIIAAALWIAANQPWANMLAAGASISACLLATAKAFEILNNCEKIQIESIVQMLVGALAMIFIGYALSIAADQPWQGILAASAGISACLIAIGAAFAIINSTASMSNLAPALAEFAAGVVGVAGIGVVLTTMANSADWKNLLSAGVSVSVVLLAMAVAMGVCALVGNAAPAAIIGIGLLDVFVADLTLVMYALGKLSDDNKAIIADGGRVLVSIGEAIGNFAGSIIEGIGNGIANSLESIGKSLTTFMENSKGFFDGLKNLDEDTLKCAQILAGVILAIAAAELVEGISNFISIFTGKNGMESFAQDLSVLGQALVTFDQTTKPITDPEHFRLVAEAAGYLVEMSKNLPNSGGLLGEILGNNDMDTWGQQLAIMGKYIAQFANTISSISNDSFSKFQLYADSVKPLIEMSQTLPNSSGWIGEIFGNNDMDTWGQQLSTMGIYVARFANNIASISNDVFNKFGEFANAVKPLIDLTQLMPNSGGWLGGILGDNKADEWAKQLAEMGKYIAKFAANISPIDSASFSKFSTFDNSTRHLVDFFGYLKESSGIAINKILVNSFCDSVVMISEALRDFCKNTKDVNTSRVVDISRAFVVLADAVDYVSEFKGAKAVSELSDALGKLATVGIKTFINEFSTKAQEASNAAKSFMNGVLTTLKNGIDDFQKMGANQIAGYVKGLKDYSGVRDVKDAGEELAKAATKGIESAERDFKKAGEDSVDNYAKGLEDYSNRREVEDAGEELAEAGIEGIKNSVDDFEDVGEDCVEGFIDGLSDSYLMRRVRDAAEDLAYEAKRAAERELDINSPSRVFRAIGQFSGEGYVLGLEDWFRASELAGEGLADKAINSLDGSMSAINDSMSALGDLNPVITPMVDLTNVIDAANTIGAMFASAIIGTSNSASSIGSVIRTGSVSNSEEEFQNDDSSGGNTYNFIQNNTSPKSLSRIDIYRQTKNQFAQFREAVEGV